MLIDVQNLLCDSQAPTTGTTVSTNTIDLGAPDTVVAGFQARGAAIHDQFGKEQEVLVQVDVQCTSTSSDGTVQVQLISSASADLSTPTVLCSSAAIIVTTLKPGYQFRLKPPHGITQRYFGCQFVHAVHDLTAGSFTVGLVDTIQSTHPNG